MRLDITSEEFWASDGPTNFIDRLATALSIPTYRIRIVDTYEGSTVVKAHILQEDNYEGQTALDGSGEKRTIEELDELAAKLVTKAESNELEMGYPVMSLDYIVIDSEEPIEVDANGNPVPPSEEDDEPIIIILTEETEEGQDENGTIIVPGSTIYVDKSDDDEWYSPLSYSQMVAIMIGTGALVVFSALIVLMMCHKMKGGSEPRVIVPDMMPTEGDHTLSKDGNSKMLDMSGVVGVVPKQVAMDINDSSEMPTPHRAWDEVPWSPTDARQNPEGSLMELDTPKVGSRPFPYDQVKTHQKVPSATRK
jgi:hypothetical protein